MLILFSVTHYEYGTIGIIGLLKAIFLGKDITVVIYQSLSDFVYFRGRVALYAILQAIGIKKGDEVITQAFTCIAVPEAIIVAGAKPVYVDIEFNSVNMDANSLFKKISSKTKAIVVQHTYGIPADMDNIIKIAEEKKIPIIEDCCHSFASTYKGKVVGTFGIGSFYSFEWGKPIIAGIGGSAIINDSTLQKRLKDNYKKYQLPSWINQLQLRLQYNVYNLLYSPSRYWFGRYLFHKMTSLGIAKGNYNPIQEGEHKLQDYYLRMSDYHKKLLDKQINKIERLINHSKWVTSQYQTQIKSTTVSHLKIYDKCNIIFAHYPLITNNKQRFLEKAQESNIEIAEWYSTPIHPIKSNKWTLINYKKGSCPNAEMMCTKIVTLPTNKKVTRSVINNIVNFLNKVY